MKQAWFIFILAVATSCNPQPELLDGDLDTLEILDRSLLNPENFLVSAMYPTPDAATLQKTVVIAAHGYSASTYEWDELRTFLSASPRANDVLISQVLLGAHGRNYYEFKTSTWRDWQSSIIEEYDRLVDLGYTKFVFVGSSTGGTLLLELFRRNYFKDKVQPLALYLIDPIVIPSDKLLSIIPVMGPIIGYTESAHREGEEIYWYRYRPQETLRELNKLIRLVRKSLEDGVNARSTYVKVFKTTRDYSADAAGAVLIYRGMRTSSGRIAVEMIDSDLHVFTRLQLRRPEEILPAYVEHQRKAFTEILSH